MFRSKLSSFGNLICFAILLFFSLQLHAQNGFSPQLRNRLQQVLDSIQNSPANPVVGGISVAIKVDDLASWEGVSGYRSRNVNSQNELLPGGLPFEKQTLSRMYSVTKTFTAPLVLQLSAEGFFSLQDPISKYLPVKQLNPLLNDQVTLLQLLSHESGYSDYLFDQNLQTLVGIYPDRIWQAPEIIPFLKQTAPPGKERRYISSNYVLLGAIIEHTTGKKVEDLYRERFFKPLGLNSMFLAEREPIGNRGNLADPHDNLSPFNPIFSFTGRTPFPNYITNIKSFPFNTIASLAFTGGGLVTNARDMAEWGSALFGGRATSETVLQTMLNSISKTPDEDGDFLGYGIWSNKRVSETDYFVGHNGFAPGYRSVLFYQPDRKLTFSVLVNTMSVDPYDIAKALYAAIPNFLCGNENRKEAKIMVCYKGETLCVDRKAAAVLIDKGAYLGACGDGSSAQSHIAEKAAGENNRLVVFPNPFAQNAKVNLDLKDVKGQVTINLFNLEGLLVTKLYQGTVPDSGKLNLDLDGTTLPKGNYVVQVSTAAGTLTQRASKLE